MDHFHALTGSVRITLPIDLSDSTSELLIAAMRTKLNDALQDIAGELNDEFPCLAMVEYN